MSETPATIAHDLLLLMNREKSIIFCTENKKKNYLKNLDDLSFLLLLTKTKRLKILTIYLLSLVLFNVRVVQFSSFVATKNIINIIDH